MATSIPLLVLSGTPYQTGLQYGHLMHNEIAEAVASEEQALGPMLATIGMSQTQLIDRVAALGSMLPADVHDELRGMSKSSGIAADTLLRHTSMLDILSGAPIGCSQFAAFGRATAGGIMIHGHNLDVPYRSLAKYIRPACVVYRRPGEVPYVSITLWPSALGVCTGMNAEGLSLGVNVPVAPLDHREYYPLTFQNRKILSRATRIPRALDVLHSTQRGGNWNLLLADRSGRACVWEQAGAHCGQSQPSSSADFVISTNHFVEAHKSAPGTEGIVLRMLQDMQVDSLHRYRRLQELVEHRYGHVDVDTAIAFLMDCVDTDRTANPNGRTVCRADNVLSMVYVPSSQLLDFAAGQQPAALGPRHRIPLRDHFQDRIELVEPLVAETSGPFPMLGEPDGHERFRRTFDLREDIYLREHLVNGIPVLPGAAAIEWLAEVAAAGEERRVAEIRDVSLDKFIRVRESQPMTAHVNRRVEGDFYEVAAHADVLHPKGTILQPDVMHYRARVRLGEREHRVVNGGEAENWAKVPRIPFSRSYVKDAYFHVGTPFRIVNWICFPNRFEAIASLRVPEPIDYYTSAKRVRFWIDPFLLDGCFQAVGTLGILRNAKAPVPRRLGRLLLGVDPQPGEDLICRGRLLREEDEVLRYDFTVCNASGRVCFSVHEYASISVDAYTKDQQDQLANALDPSGMLRTSGSK